MAKKKININRAPVLTLWAAVVAERFGYNRKEALTLAKAVAGLNAQSKGRHLGIYEEKKDKIEEQEQKTKSRQIGIRRNIGDEAFLPSKRRKVCAPPSKAR